MSIRWLIFWLCISGAGAFSTCFLQINLFSPILKDLNNISVALLESNYGGSRKAETSKAAQDLINYLSSPLVKNGRSVLACLSRSAPKKNSLAKSL